ncbi:PAS domain S-box-containing protein [Roseimicrobium gellanilyticum]|uniref:histidine kinase n=1 Tax=Roseimicrobium gellanilyticum TaxID=748857 RepID=A0A366HMF6_9BACT|nr:PAS domain S-box protein [Roseimicrobium gellanilyticum]RBP44338.1 PAS domain S-box-containing protein [Roseimicrobium gellanilyticum]
MNLPERPVVPTPVPSPVDGGVGSAARAGNGLLTRQVEAILNHMSDAFIAMDRDWRIISVNPAYLKLVEPLYLSVEDLLGYTLWEKFPDIVQQEVGHRYRAAMELQREDRMELLYEPLGRWLEVHMHPSPESLAIFIQDITERKLSDSILRESEERYRTLFKAIDEGFCVFDMLYDASGTPVDYRFVEVNPAFERHTGLKDAAGYTLRELVPDANPSWFTIYGEVARTGVPVRFQNEDAGLKRRFDAYALRVGGEGSHRVAVIFTDISERHAADAALKESEERYRTLFTSLDDGFCVFDMIYDEAGKPVDYRFTEVNPSFERHTGLKGAQGKTIKEMVPTHEPHWFEIYGRIAETGVPEHFTHVGAGMNRWFEVRAFRMGAPELRRVAAIFSDVTQRYMTEKALKESEERYRNLFNAIDEGVCLCEMLYDASGKAIDYRILEVNPAFGPSTGLHGDKVLGKTARELMLAPDRRIGMYAQVVATGEPLRYQTYVESIGRWLDIFVSRVGGEGSRFFVPVFSDITARRLAEQTLQESKEAAEAANAAKDRFLAVLSHELRTPLTPVLMTAAARELDPEIPSGLREDMAMIRRNVELETKLIDDLLDLSRITSGKLALRMEAVDLNTVVRHVCGICRPQILEKEVLLRMELDPNAGLVRVDPARLQQILWNIVKNAAKFTPDGGWIHVRTQRVSNERTCVRVADSGIGIAPDVLPRIFDAFEQGDEQITRQFGGLGLGLAISKALAELHGGSITASSSGEGSGSTFTMELPVAREEQTLKSTPLSPRPEQSPQQVRVLLVEDHPDTARVLAVLLRRAGYNVDTAVSVASALELGDANTYDLLVSDLGLPDGSGYELMRRMRETRPMKGIAMSGFGMDRDVQKSLQAGFSEHVVKPVDIGQLQAAMRRAMDR